MSLKFSTWHLVIDAGSPSAEELKPVFAEAEDNASSTGTHYLIAKENLRDKYFWLYARYGKSLPHSTTVYNTKNQKEENNPRSTDQVEPAKQLFALYCIHSHTLYLSNNKQKSWVEKYLQAKLKKNVVIKAFFQSAEEFLQTLKSVNKLKFVLKRDLFNMQADIMKIFPNPNDLFGLGMPERFAIETHFSHAKPTRKFITDFKKFAGLANSYQAKSLLCVGVDDKGFEKVFNVDSFIEKVSVKAAKDGQDLYDPTSVKKALISKIGGSDEENS